MDTWESQILVVAGVTILAVISPGPDFAVTSRNSLMHGRAAGLATAAGIACGVSVHVTYTLLGLGYILAKADWLLDILRYGGAAYLVYLGVSAFLKQRTTAQSAMQQDDQPLRISRFQMFRNGFLCNAFNPKTALFFIALFSQAVAPTTPMPAQMAFGLFIALAHLVWFSIVAGLLTHPTLQAWFGRIKTGLERVIGLCLVGLGVKLALS
ncbi:LysE family transporter [Aestuariispira ectoiniformans]|uniref:LysE family transporter n=1 Tax=Aestuariispira ectoiniformans TaxID=2775080 RepID=UPI00223A7982|nr:LysE family transporter [Aestuariispira ectoiniformans]